MSSSNVETLVVGGGISGLYAALLLARRGRRVRVIERAARLGGLAGAEEFRGIPCDLGSHRIHPSALEKPLFRELNARTPLLRRPRRGVLLLGDRRVPYPPTAIALARAIGLPASLSTAAGFLGRAGRRRAFADWESDRASIQIDRGFERFVRERVGERAYQAFYRPYAEKVWGLDPAELSQTIAKKRVSATRPWALVASAAGRAARWIAGDHEHGDDDPTSSFVYPERGAASIVAWLSAELARAGVSIERGRAFEPGDRDRGPVLFAGDLRDLVPTSLEHRGLYLVYLALPVERVSESETYYSPDTRHWFGRVAEIQNYSPALRTPGETILCVEIPEGAWGPGRDFARGELHAALLAQLRWAGIVPRGVTPIESRQRFLPSVYPLYRRGWIDEWRTTMARVSTLGNVVPIGRQALFLHINLDHCADIAEAAVDHVLAGKSTAKWIEKAEEYLEIRVRD
ncbi:MAG: NAD(P)-binding protein [Byssovorax sp.]